MAVTPTDLNYYKSSVTSTVGNTNGRTIESLGGDITNDRLITGTFHNLFDSVTAAEAAAGRTEYRCIYVKNDNGLQTLYDAVFWISLAATGVDTLIEIAPDPAADDTTSAIALVDEIDSTNQLAGITNWTQAPDEANAIQIGDLPAGRAKAIWVRRAITAGQPALTDSCILSIRGDTDA
ncbi:hypothetical protein VPHD479_0424 [Vibrio phage D479]